MKPTDVARETTNLISILEAGALRIVEIAIAELCSGYLVVSALITIVDKMGNAEIVDKQTAAPAVSFNRFENGFNLYSRLTG